MFFRKQSVTGVLLKCLLTIISQNWSPNNHGHTRKLCMHQALLELQITSNGLIPVFIVSTNFRKNKELKASVKYSNRLQVKSFQTGISI